MEKLRFSVLSYQLSILLPRLAKSGITYPFIDGSGKLGSKG
jgi:hypothetical protein